MDDDNEGQQRNFDVPLVGMVELDRGGDELVLFQFKRGDANADDRLSLADVVHMNDVLGGAALIGCAEAADANDDEVFDSMDPTYLLTYLFLSGPPPPAPFPDCGIDPPPYAVTDDLPCIVPKHPACP